MKHLVKSYQSKFNEIIHIAKTFIQTLLRIYLIFMVKVLFVLEVTLMAERMVAKETLVRP